MLSFVNEMKFCLMKIKADLREDLRHKFYTSFVSIIDLPLEISVLISWIKRLHLSSTMGYVNFVFIVVNAGEISARLSFHSSLRKINGLRENNRAFSLLYYFYLLLLRGKKEKVKRHLFLMIIPILLMFIDKIEILFTFV